MKTKTDVTGLKSRAETAESKLQQETESKLNAEVATAAGKNPDAWTEHVKANGLTFKKTTVKDENDKDVTAITVISKGENGATVETPLKDYVAQKAAHVAAATPQKKKNNFGFPKEETPEGDLNEFEQIRKEAEEKNKANTSNNVSFADQFFGNIPK